MTREEAIFCMKSYLPEGTYERCPSCKYYENCKSSEAHKMAIKALEQEPKTRHWVHDDECKEHGHCDKCGYKTDLVDGEPHTYCPRCGAKMVEPQESEDEE